jgi:hypothetical protein
LAAPTNFSQRIRGGVVKLKLEDEAAADPVEDMTIYVR